jgi:fatty-acyl-CoA synthase
MNLSMFVEMVADAVPDRIALGTREAGLTYADLLARARSLGAGLAGEDVRHVGLVDVNSEAVPLLLYACAASGRTFVPLNYRLADLQLRAALARIAPAVVIAGADQVARCEGVEGIRVLTPEQLTEVAAPSDAVPAGDPAENDIAVLLFTSGTSGEPKAAVLRQGHLASYVLSTVEFLGAGDDEAILVSVPPYHIAAVSSVLSSTFAGRRMVQLPAFTPEGWVDLARTEQITHAMVVPTMLGRILDVLEDQGERLPHLRHLSYGGGRMPGIVVERALRLLPHVDFVNAYGLTETSSTIAVLDPESHRAALASADPEVRSRLGSVGRPLPTVELEVRDPSGSPVAAGESGEIWVRGEQVSGEYLTHRALDEDGWFPTRDRGRLDSGGFLFVEGRADDVIVRGGENISPGEIEDVLLLHPAVADAGVIGLPDTEWGEAVVAVVVLRAGAPADEPELQSWVRERLRSSRTPARVHFRGELPHNETGKLLRRVLRDELNPAPTR